MEIFMVVGMVLWVAVGLVAVIGSGPAEKAVAVTTAAPAPKPESNHRFAFFVGMAIGAAFLVGCLTLLFNVVGTGLGIIIVLLCIIAGK